MPSPYRLSVDTKAVVVLERVSRVARALAEAYGAAQQLQRALDEAAKELGGLRADLGPLVAASIKTSDGPGS